MNQTRSMPTRGMTLPPLPDEVHAELWQEAQARGLSVEELIARLLVAVADSDLWVAVLDDEE